jgi:hypothetical protein
MHVLGAGLFPASRPTHSGFTFFPSTFMLRFGSANVFQQFADG